MNLARIFWIGFWVYLVLYVLALFVLLIGTFGWFGQEKDPLSGVFIVILGQPWVRLVDLLPERNWPIASSLTPIINLGILCIPQATAAPAEHAPDLRRSDRAYRCVHTPLPSKLNVRHRHWTLEMPPRSQRHFPANNCPADAANSYSDLSETSHR